MNKFFKRLALLLAVLMIVSMMPVQLFADNSVTGEEQSNGTGENSYLTISGIAGFEDRQFASFADAYTAIKPALEGLCDNDALGQGVATAGAFDALFTNRDENGNATLTYTISGNVVYDETDYANLLTMGRRASHYGNDRHLINFKFVGATGKEADTLTVNSDITLPYEWWGEKTVTSISFENLTITGSAPSGLYPHQPYFDEINFKVDNCNLKGIKIYNCSNVKGTYTITNSTLDGTGAPADAYAIHLQGHETEPLTINISGNTISGYDRGINIDQKTANATISGNTISIKDAGRSCIQLSSLTSTVISNNTLELTGGNAITLHELLLGMPTVPVITVEGNTITGNGYLIYDDAVANGKTFTSENLALTIGINTVASTVDTTQGVKGSDKFGLSETVDTVVKDALTPAYVAKVNGTGYATLADAIAAANGNGTVTLLTATTELVQALLDGQYGSIDGLTIELPTGDYGKLELGRATKYAGSKTEYFVGGFDSTDKNHKAFANADEIREYKGQSTWTPNCFYRRALNNVTIKAADGATVTIEKISADAGQIYGKADAPKYDYVLDVEIPDTNKSYWMALAWNNVTFEGINFKSSVNIESSSEKTLIDGLHFEKCNFNSGYTALAAANDANKESKGMGIRFVSWTTTTNNLRNLTVNNCTFEDCSEGVYTNPVYGVSVTNSSFNNINHNAVAIQDVDKYKPVDHGNVVISGNTFTNVSDRIIRFNNAGEDTTITITDNTSVNSGKKDNGEIIKATTMPDSVKINMTSNTWGDVNGKTAVFGDGFNKVVVAEVNGKGYATLADAITNATPDANGVITYEISGKATVDSTGWVQVARAGLTGLTKVEFVGKTSDAEICITGGLAILADQNYDIDVSFEALTLSKLNPTYGGDYGHSTNYFTTWLRNTNAAENTVTYTNCTFPNGLCNNQYGKTVVDGCTFSNTTTKLYNFWNYSNVLDGETTGVANTEIKNSKFTGVRGIKIYSEKTHGGEVLVSNTTFDGLTEKAAIVASKAVAVTVENVSVSGDNGFFTRDITGNDEVMLKVAGTGISGIFNITSDTNAEAAKEELNISGGTFTSEVSSDYLADGFELKKNSDGTYGVEKEQPQTVATVNGVGYSTLADAIAAAKDGETVTLTADINTPETSYYIQKSLTIDLGGKTLTGSGYDGVFNIEGENAAVLIKNGKIVAVEQTGTAGKYTMAVWACAAGCEVTLEDLDVSQQITHTDDKQMDMIYTSKGTIIINSGRFESGTPAWTLNCNDSAYKAGTAKIIVNGGTFVGYDPRNNTAEGEGTSFVAEGVGIDKNADGTFTAKAGMTAQVMDAKGASVKAFATLAEAIAAAKRNNIVKLMANTKENVTISTRGVTLDLNGFTLNGSTGERKPALTITERYVTIKDSSEGQTGTIMRDDTPENSGVSSHYVIDIQGNGWLTFESGTVKNGSGAGGTKGASLVRVGSDSVAKYPSLNIKGGTFTQDNFIVIKVERGDLFLNGGSLNSANSYAVQTWHRATIKGGTVNGNVSSWTYSGGLNSTLEISGGTINGDVESVSYDGSAGKKAKASITGGTVNGTLIAGIYNSMTEPTKEMATIEVTGGTFTEDPTKYVIEDSAITKNADGTFGVAKAYLAQVGENKYYTMDEAFKAQTTSGEPIVMLRDYTTGSTFNSGTVARVVDLNGHTWTCTGTDANSAAFEINNPNASLTVKNGKIVSSQLVGLIPSAMGGTITYDNSALVFEDVEMSTTATSGIETNGNNTNDTVKLVNSTLNVPNGFGIYFPSSGKLIIENSKITAKTMGVQVCSGALSISGANTAITVTGDAVEKTENDGAIQDGAAISIVNRTGYKGLEKVEIENGKFTSKEGNVALKAYNWENKTESKFTASEKVAVSGGTFSSEVSEDLCADGFVPTNNADGTYGVKTAGAVEVWTAFSGTKVASYDTIAEAAANLGENKWIVITKDYTLTEDFVIPTGVFLDIEKGATLTVADGVTLTVAADCKRLGVRTGATLINNGTVLVCGTSPYDGGKVVAFAGGTVDLNKLTVPTGYFLDNSGTGYFASIAIFEITYSDGSTKPASAYTSWKNAVKVTLLTDVSDFARSSVKDVAENFVLDLGGFILSGTTTASTNVLGIDAPMTIKNGTIKYVSSNTGYGALKTSADVTIASGVIIDGGAGYAVYTDGYGHTLTVNGTVKSDGSYAITSNGSENGGRIADCSIIVNDGAKIEAPNGIGIYHPELGTVTVNGGEITAHTGIEMCAGKLVVKGGKITSTGANWDATGSQNAILDGAAVSIINRNYPGGIPTAEISGGKFVATGKGAQTIKAYDYTNNTVAEWTNVGESVSVSGGTFSSIPDNMEMLCAEGFIPTKNADDTYGVKEGKYVAQIGDVKYETLAEAIAAAKDGDTVKLLADCSGNGIKVEEGKFADKGLIVDFGGHTYTVGGVLVGSAGTGTNAFQLLQGNKITFMNGSIVGATENTKPAEDTPNWHGAPAIMIQNYCDLTLKNMTVTGGDETVYTMSNNHGDVVIEDSTINAGKAKGYTSAPIAFDACGYSSYDGVSVTVKGTSVINGDIEISRSSNNAKDVKLTLESGTVNGTLKIDSSIKSGDATTITKSITFELAAPTGYEWFANMDGTQSLSKAYAKIGETYYKSLADALEAANAGDTIVLLDNVTLNSPLAISNDVTIDLNKNTIDTKAGVRAITITSGNVTIKNGTVKMGTVVNGSTSESGYTIYVNTAEGENVTLNLEDVTVIGGENQKSGVTDATVEQLIANGMKGYQTTAGTALYIYGKMSDGNTIVNIKNSTIIGGYGSATNGTQTKYISGGANMADGGDAITAIGDNVVLTIIDGSTIKGGDSDLRNAGIGVELQSGTLTVDGSTVTGGSCLKCDKSYGMAGDAVYVGSAAKSATIKSSTVIGGNGGYSYDGSGVEIRKNDKAPATVTIEDSTIKSGNGENANKDYAGAIYLGGWDDSTDLTLKGDNTLAGSDGKYGVIRGGVTDGIKLDGNLTIDEGTLKDTLLTEVSAGSTIKSGENAKVDADTVVSSDENAAMDTTPSADGTYSFVAAVAQVIDRVGNKLSYASIDAAIAAADAGETVKLLADVTADVVINKNITLDLGGKTLTNTGAGKATISIANGATATVKNGNVIGGATYYNIEVTKGSNANLTLEDVTATAGNTGSSMIDNWGTLAITSGTYTGGLNVVKSEEGSTLTINGGKFELNYAVNNNYNGVILSAGTTMITDGEFIQNATTPRWGHPQVVLAMQEDGYISKIEITGGTFTNNKSGESIFHGSGKANSSNFEVSGGTFNKSVSQSYFTKGYECVKKADGTYGVQEATKGSKNYPYTLAELSVMTRDEYIAAQKALGGTMYVEIGDYSYDKNGVLGNGVRNDTPGQTEDRSVLNGYNSNGYLGEKNDGANGKNIIFVGGSVTSGVTGYASIDNIGTSLLLAVPAYTNVTFEGTTFNNVMSFDYQLYTGPWSQLGKLKFDNCKFNGLIVGAIASQTLTFNKCTFTNYINTISANNSNPTWIRPAYGNWSKGDNEGQGSDFKSLTTINFTNNTVTSTRPVKFERIAQWEMDTKVSVKNNKVTISAQEGDTSTKNVGFYFGANAKFDLTLDGNKKLGTTSALYTAVYSAPNGTSYAGLPAGSTVKDSNGADVEVAGVIWKTTDALTLKTTTEAVEVGGVKFATLEEAFAAAKNGDTITLLSDVEMTETIKVTDGKKITLALNGFNVTITATGKFIRVCNAELTITGNGTIKEQNPYFAPIIIKGGAEGSENYSVVNIKEGVTLEGWSGVMIDQTSGTANNYGMVLNVEGATLNGVNDTSGANGSGIYVNGVVKDAKITLTNTTVTGTGTGMYLAGNADTTINGGSVKGDATGIEIRAGKLTLNNCDVTGGNGEVTATANGNGTTVTNAALAISQHTTKKPIDVTINGGTFNGTAAVYQTDVQGTGSVDVKVAVNDGTFNGEILGETDGAIVISGGKFKDKVDDKYFADGFACSTTPNADGYYTVKDHPITGLGLSIGESLTLRITVDESYKNGKLKYTYIGAKDGKVHSGIVYRAEKDKKGNWVFRISDINAQRADVIYTVQYVDESEKEVGYAKEVSILKYCEGLVEQYKNADEAVKNSVNTLVCKLLNYSASAMDYRQETDGGDRYNNMTWGERATALRKRTVELCGTVTDYAFEVSHEIRDYGTDKNAVGVNGEKKVGIEFSDKIRLFFNINYNENYTYTYNGLKCIPEEVSGASTTTHRIYVTVAPFAYDSEHCIEISDADGFVYEIAYSLDNALESLAEKYSGTAAGNLAKATYEYCRALTDFAKYFK